MSAENRGKFRERIKNIRYNRRRKKDNTAHSNGAVLRIILFPLMIFDKKNRESKKEKVINKQKIQETLVNDKTFLKNNRSVLINHNVNLFNKNNSKLKSNVRPEWELLVNKQTIVNNKIDSISNNLSNTLKNNTNNVARVLNIRNIKNENDINKKGDMHDLTLMETKVNANACDILSRKIINDITKSLIKNINNLETIESDLYVLSKFDGERDSLNKCREYIAKLHALQNKLNKIRNQFNILKENTDFDEILDIEDKFLLDELIEFRDSIDKDVVMQTSENYKLLAEYKYLYSRIDRVINDTNKLEMEVNNRKLELEKANIDFNEFQNKVYSYDSIEKETTRIFNRQNDILNEIANKVSDISVTKKVDYVYKGFLDVFLNGLKLFGLYMLSPFKKSIPGVAIATVATKKIMGELIDAMQVEKRTRYIYSATNYSDMLSFAINDLSSLDNLIVDTLSDVRSVKEHFISKFSPYAKELSRYNSTLKKINQIEKLMINNQLKVRILAEKIKNKKKINDNTLVKVKKMNSN